jgi:hypothetical protein
MRFRSVDFPTLGLPIIDTNPDLNLVGALSSLYVSGLVLAWLDASSDAYIGCLRNPQRNRDFHMLGGPSDFTNKSPGTKAEHDGSFKMHADMKQRIFVRFHFIVDVRNGIIIEESWRVQA